MNNRQRFLSQEEGRAPISFGAPANTQNVEYEVFKCTPEQKLDKIAAKFKHKMYLKEKGVNPKKYLNIPENRLEAPIKFST